MTLNSAPQSLLGALLHGDGLAPMEGPCHLTTVLPVFHATPRIQLARVLDAHRNHYDAFLVVHGTDTMAYSASAVSLMLYGFRKPIVFTGSQLPLAMPRSDARQNLIDSLTCATAYFNPPHVHFQVRVWRRSRWVVGGWGRGGRGGGDG